MRKNSKAFTLIETMIGITIFAVGIVAIFSLLLISLRMNQDTVMRVQAVELAREGLEIVRNIRDSNWGNNYPYSEGAPLWGGTLSGEQDIIVSPALSATIPWYIQTVQRGDRESYRLKKQQIGNTSLIGHLGEENTPFYRYIVLSAMDINHESDHNMIHVQSVVQWESGGKIREVHLSTVLTNWKKI